MRRILVRRRLAGMATWYPLILLLHLSCAIVFIGAVAFEVLVLESLHRHFEHDIMARIEAAVMARARRFMPFVVALLFLSGFALFDIRCDGFACIGSRFGWLLSAKVALARSEEHTSELQSLMRISYAVFCLKKKKDKTHTIQQRAL